MRLDPGWIRTLAGSTGFRPAALEKVLRLGSRGSVEELVPQKTTMRTDVIRILRRHSRNQKDGNQPRRGDRV